MCVWFIVVFEDLLTFWYCEFLGLYCIFSALVLESAISPRGPSSLYWRIELGFTIWAMAVPVDNSDVASQPSGDRTKKQTCVYRFMYIHVRGCSSPAL